MQKHSILIGIALVTIIGIIGCSSPLEGPGAKPPAPKKPSLAADDASLVVDWQSLDMVESYSVYCGTSQIPPSVPAQTGITGTSATITELVNDTLYYVWVQALNERGASALSPASSILLRPRPATGTELRDGQWAANTISNRTQTDYYYFAVTTGATYTIRWNDRFDGDGTKTAGVQVGAYWADTNMNIFMNAFNGYTTGKSFTANKDGWVMINVQPAGSSYTGTYAVMFKKH
jgi:hypothetical protein